MDFWSNILFGLEYAVTPEALLYCTLGVVLGTLIGVLPGIGAMSTIALLLPITFHLQPATGLIMLAGIFYGSAYGGSTASILLNLPGTPMAAVTCLDGYPMTCEGRGGVALFMTAIASFVGSIVGMIILVTLAPPLADIALQFSSAEYFGLMLMGLVASALFATAAPFRSFSMITLGLLFGVFGTDVSSGVVRFAFGMPGLYDGVSLVAMALGLFGVPEIIRNAGNLNRRVVGAKDITLRSMIPTRDDIRRSIGPIFRGTIVGSIFGALPGAGGTAATFLSYGLEKRISKTPERFGNGAIEGIVSPEAANNSNVQTAFIPTLTLGIPGDAVMALMLATLMVHNVVPGPQLLNEHPEVFWGLSMSFLIGNILLLVLNIPMIGLWVRLVTVPYKYLMPAIVVFICIGVYTIRNSVFDIGQVLVFGAMGYGIRLLRFEVAPILLGLVLGPMMEEHLRKEMLISKGSFMTFLERPISASILAITVAMFLFQVFSTLRKKRALKKAALAAAAIS